MKNFILFFSLLFLSLGCATQSAKFNQQYNYEKNLLSATRHEKKYSGLSNVYQVSVTHLSPKIYSLKDQKLAFLQQWPSHRIEEASQKQQEDLSKHTVFVLILYTPNGKNNDFKKGDDSIWRTYLEVDGQRFRGVAGLAKYKPSQVYSLYPGMTRFSKAYQVKFPIADSEAFSSGNVRFILTSDLGTSEFTF
jgi:hypothetical protein